MGRDDSGTLKYKYLYSRNLSDLKEKMLITYVNIEKYFACTCSKSLIELCKEWIGSAKLRVKPSSFYCYEKIINKHIIPYFFNIKYSELNTPAINAFVEYKLNSGRIDGHGGLSAKSVHDILVVMRSVARYAENEYNYKNPLKNISMPKAEKNETEVFTKTECRKIQLYLQNNMSCSNLGIILSMYTGLRIGELCALTWKNFDEENGVIHVTKTLQRIVDKSGNKKTKLEISTPKSKSSVRDVPLPNAILSLMKSFIKDNDKFILSGTNIPVEPRTMQNRFKAVLKKCKIRNANFHLLRHTYATACIANGFDAKTVSELLGHSNVNITLNRYVHSSMEMKKKHIEKLNFVA